MLLRLIILLLTLPAIAHGDAENRAVLEHVEVELVVGHESVKPGSESFVGLLFKLDPGWHVYWKNPGDSGEPPSVKWSVPGGVSVGEFRWPAPHKILMGPIVTFGYENEVLLSAPLVIASDFQGDAIEIKAAATWLVCADVCLGQEVELVLSLPVRPDEMVPTAASESPSLTQIPKPASADGGAILRKGGLIELALDPDVFRPGPKYTFFPDEDVVELAKLTEQRMPTFTAPRSPTRTEPIERISGVMVMTNAEGRHAFWFDVPVQDHENLVTTTFGKRWEDYWWIVLPLGALAIPAIFRATRSKKRT
ncbi:MAG: protein-disulfide reductase DsbD domain-containing protein [Planctomycetota bacterium]